MNIQHRHPATRARGSSPTVVVARAVTIAVEAVVAVGAFGGGAAMIADPTGAMGLDPQMLDRLPVDTWRLPGVALIACNGLLPVATALADLRGHGWPRRYGHAVAGAVLLAWPLTETVIFGYPLENEPVWLRPAVAAAGAGLLGGGLLLRRAARAQHAASTPGGPVRTGTGRAALARCAGRMGA